jgi:glycosyltransferase involved in cell wall biosynthesis
MTPLRVLLMTTYYAPLVGGVETHARSLAAQLLAHGHRVDVLTTRVSGDLPAKEVLDGVMVHRHGRLGDRKTAGKWLAIPFFSMRALALRENVDAIVCVDYRGIGIAAILAGRLSGKPVIVQAGTAGVLASTSGESEKASGVPAEAPAVRLIKAPARFVYRRADHYVCVARDIEREALDAGIPRSRVHYLPHGVDIDRFRPASEAERRTIRREIGWPDDELIVLFVGRLSVEKGVMDLLEAWSRAALPRARLAFVGPDMPGHPWDAGAPARQFVADRGLSASVTFAGAVAEPSPFFRAADLFVQPSHFEAFGISVIEAMASGVPVIAARVGGMRDFIVDGVNAVFHRSRDANDLAAALRRLVGDEAARERIGAEGRRTVEAQFDERMLSQQYIALIETAVAHRRGAS